MTPGNRLQRGFQLGGAALGGQQTRYPEVDQVFEIYRPAFFGDTDQVAETPRRKSAGELLGIHQWMLFPDVYDVRPKHFRLLYAVRQVIGLADHLHPAQARDHFGEREASQWLRVEQQDIEIRRHERHARQEACRTTANNLSIADD